MERFPGRAKQEFSLIGKGLQSVEQFAAQAQLVLMGALFTSRHPADVVFKSGVSLVILQPWAVLFDTGRHFLMHLIPFWLMMLSGLLLIICFISVLGMLPSTRWIVFQKAPSYLWSLPHFWLQKGVGRERGPGCPVTVGPGLASQ